MLMEFKAEGMIQEALYAFKAHSREKSKKIADMRETIRKLKKENNGLRIAHKASTHRANETEKRRVALLERIREMEQKG